MDGFSISKIILGLQNPELFLKKLNNAEGGKLNSFSPQINSSLADSRSQTNQMVQSLQILNDAARSLQMNTLAGMDRAVFIKNLLGLPQNLPDLLLSIQNPNNPLAGDTLTLNGINQELMQNRKILSSLFAETSGGAAGVNTGMSAQVQNANASQDAIALFFSGMINMSDVSKIILQNSKQAVAALIISMASAARQGVNSSQIQDTLSIINSCIAMAESNDPSLTLKSLMMLYLPWLPLNEGVGFDLEISSENVENAADNSKLTVLIQTKNFGNIKGVFTLTTSNSVDIYIICTDKFPKKILLQNLNEESSSHAMNTTIDIEAAAPKQYKVNEVHETKVNLSAANEMNPYLLLMAHSFIRYAILIDNSYAD